jgi:MoxR-like ATPase
VSSQLKEREDVTQTPGQVYELIAANVQRVVRGKPHVVRLAVAALFSEGHLLIEDVPGLGKTTLARCLAQSIGGTWNRIQFTPDLLPGDITGVQVYHQSDEKFAFHPGSVFANVVLADEINRGTPKTQSALLEVMSEQRVTVDAVRHDVPRPFMVIATQNPIEMAGTYRLPEAQLDRFLMRLRMGYPDRASEVLVVKSDRAGVDPDELPAAVDIQTLRSAITQVRAARIEHAVIDYAASITSATRQHSEVRCGASPRGTIALVSAAQALAATYGRNFVTVDDIKEVAHPVLDHRLILKPEAELRQRKAEGIVTELLAEIPVPVAVTSAAGA